MTDLPPLPLRVAQPAPLSSSTVVLLQACVLAGDAVSGFKQPTVPLQAGYHDALLDYLDGCPSVVARHPAARALLLREFALTHPDLPSPEHIDPHPVVHDFCRNALHQLSEASAASPGPLSTMQLNRAREAALRRTSSQRTPAKGDPALLPAIKQALALSTNVLAQSSTLPAEILKLFHAHIRFLTTQKAQVLPTAAFARAFCIAVLAQLSPDSSPDDSHGGRPIRRAGRGGRP